MLKLKCLKIHQYRNVRPGAVLHFSDGHNILIGRNGTGKTTLLNLLSNLFRQTLAELSKEELAVELELDFPGGSVTASLSVTAMPGRLGEARFPERSDAGMNYHVRVVARTDDPPVESRMEAEPGVVRLLSDGIGEDVELLPTEFDFFDMVRSAIERLRNDQADHIRSTSGLLRFDESLKVLESHYSRSPILVLRQGMPLLSVHNLGNLPEEVNDLLKARFRRDENLSEFIIEHNDLSALQEVVRILDFRGAQLRVSLSEKQVKNSLTTEYSFGSPRYLFTQRNGSIIPLEHLSYGQKRLFAFFLYLGANPDILIADELVNGLHHSWIEECMQAMGDRQTFLTSQNPLLLDYLSFGSVKDVQQTFVMCRLEHKGDDDELVWDNMTAEEASMFFDAYQVGLQQVGEILKTRGLW